MRTRPALAVAVLTAALFGSSHAASGLPDQAAPGGDEHAHTHGPDGVELDRRGRVAAGEPFEVDAHAPWSWNEYDAGIYTDDGPDRYAGMAQVHAVYVYPSDKPSRFGQFAAMFQADARQASKLVADNYGYGVRFDERVGGTDGTTAYLDITVLRSQYNYRQLSGSRQFSLVSNELSNKFPGTSKKYVAWLDAGSRYCGQGHLYQDARRVPDNANDVNRTTAIVYRPYDPADEKTGGFCRGRTLLHEVGHNLGALQDDAPNDFDGAHCKDDDNDAMCYTSEATFDSGGPLGKFDYGNDDYWDAGADVVVPTVSKPNLGWWAVNLSKFICPPAGGVPDCGAENVPAY